MAKRTTKTSGTGTDEAGDAPKRPARKTAAKKAAPKRTAAPRRAPDEEPAPKRRPSRRAGIGSALRNTANTLLAKADDEAVKAILTAGALAAAAVILGDKAADEFKDRRGDGEGLTPDTPAGRARLKAAAAAGGAAMGAQLLKSLEETRQRKGLAGANDPVDVKGLATRAVAALVTK